MRAARAQEAVVGVTTRIARRGTVARVAKATGPAVNAAPLRMIEDVIALRAGLDGARLGECEMLEQAHVEVCALRVVQRIPPHRAEAETLRSGESRWIEQLRPIHTDRAGSQVGYCIGIANLVEVGSDSGAVSDAGVQQTIDYAEWRSGLKSSDPGNLPTA